MAKSKWDSGPRLYGHAQCDVIPEGKKWVSVTSYQQVINKPAIGPWMVKMMATEMMRMYDDGELTMAPHEMFTILDRSPFETKVTDAKFAHRRASDKAKDIGTEVHDMAENYLLGNEVVLKDRGEEVMKSFNAFMEWVKEHSVTSIHGELAVAHEGHKYAGRLDQLCYVDGVRCVVDFKTSSGFYPEHGMQNAAYLRAYERMTGEDIPGCIVAIFKKTGGKPIIKDISEQVDDYFTASMAALSLWRSMQRIQGKDTHDG